PGGMSTTVIDYLLPARHQTAGAMPRNTPQDASRSRSSPPVTPDARASDLQKRSPEKSSKNFWIDLRSGKEPVHNADARLERGQRDALGGAVEHGEVVARLRHTQ